MIVLNTIHPQTKAYFLINKPSVCIGDDVTFTDSSNGMGGIINQWNWSYGDGLSATGSPVVTHTYGDTITYYASLYIINNFGCSSDTTTHSFTVYSYPVVNAGPDRRYLKAVPY